MKTNKNSSVSKKALFVKFLNSRRENSAENEERWRIRRVPLRDACLIFFLVNLISVCDLKKAIVEIRE